MAQNKGKKKKRKNTKKSQGWKKQLVLLCGALMAAAFLPSAALLSVGMLPTIIAVFMDSTKGHSKAVSVGALNAAGCTPFLLELWVQGHSFDKAIEIVSDPMAVIVMYASAAAGYFIDWAMSGIVAVVLYQKGLARQKAIEERQEKLIERWGKKVTGKVQLDERGFPLEEKKPALSDDKAN